MTSVVTASNADVVTTSVITQVPLTQDWYLGLLNVRGNLISVVDFARFLGQPATVPDKESRIVAFAPGLAFNCGLLVTRVLGLRNVAEMETKDQTGEGDAQWTTHRYVDREAQEWTELDLSLVVQDPQFLHVGV